MDRKERKLYGLCYVCGDKGVDGKTLCKRCAEAQSKRSKKYYQSNKGAIAERGKRYEIENKEPRSRGHKERYESLRASGLCTKCGKPAETKTTLCESCREKGKGWQREYRASHKDERRARHLERNFGIGIDEYEEMARKQEHRCAICGIGQEQLSKKLHVDHDHRTGKIRKLLCQKCNLIIGLLNDNVALAENMKKYLVSFEEGDALL